VSDRFWYILAGVVFVVINITLWFHQRWCKAKGIAPKPAFSRFKKHEKRISKWTDIFIITIILLATLSYGKLLFSDFAHSLSEKDLTVREILIKDSFTFGFLMLFFYSVWVVIMASWLSLFHQNITLKKRLILTVMCCVPLVFGTLYCIFDDSQNNQFHFKLLLGGLFPVFFINWPAILLGAPFVEFFPHLCRKIPLPWFQFPEQEDSHSD